MAKNTPNKKRSSDESSPSTSKAAAAPTESNKILQDDRFQHLVSDPRFKSLPNVQRKVKIDKRFQGMFTDQKFNVKYTVDKYGRRVNKSNADDLRKYYELDDAATTSDSEADEEQKAEEERAIKQEAGAKQEASDDAASASEGENDALDSDVEVLPAKLRERLTDPNIDYARGQGRLMSDSSSDDESSEDEDGLAAGVDHVWGELDGEADKTDEATRRLAVCNMDWDRIRAVDIMVLLSSFLPRGGSVLNVKIYTSEFGKERLAEEEKHGPQELAGLGKTVKSKQAPALESDESSGEEDEDIVPQQDSDAEEGDDYHMEKLREYQLNRLRYYYAVAECDSAASADKIYIECDGLEYESTATKVDLRFIPDDTTFDEDEPTDECSELPDANSYQPRQFTTTALQQAKVDLTWDETAVERRELGDKLSSGKLDAVSDKDLRKIIAYSSDDDEDDDEEEANGGEEKTLDGDDDAAQPLEAAAEQETKRNGKKQKKQKEDVIGKYKALLAEINEKEKKDKNKDYEMEFTWDVAAEAAATEKTVPASATAKAPAQQTPIEKVMQKRNEKNKKRKEERRKKKQQAQGIDAADANADSDSDTPDGVDMNDPYFAEEFANGDFEQPITKKPTRKQNKKHTADDDSTAEATQAASELQLLLDDDDVADEGKKHFSLANILKAEQETKSKKKRRKQLKKSKNGAEKELPEDDFHVDLNDDRFQAVYTSHSYNIDPSDSHFKKTKGMEEIIHEKLKRRHGSGSDQKLTQPGDGELAGEVEEAAKRPRKQLENALLVKSLKRKIQLKQQQQR